MASTQLPMYPLLANALLFITVAVTIGDTSATSSLRLPIFILLLSITATIASTTASQVTRSIYAVFLVSNALGLCLQYLDVALLSRWSFEARGPTAAWGGLTPVQLLPRSKSKWPAAQKSRFAFAFYASEASRLPNSPWEVNHVPYFRASAPEWTPSRMAFLRGHLMRLVIAILVLNGLDLLSDVALPPGSPVMENENGTDEVSRGFIALFAGYHDLTVKKTVEKIVTTILIRIAMYEILDGLYSLLAFASVATRISEPRDWRPMFGSLFESWSVRQFWG
ncbi:hypothetical protein G7Y89_g4630 [Cudoniella acicularis]|uniref:Wax synthase domain-containing protein n=1 Tax=Cudoniella acicularis TaxID=354080 RepID=A0A8H4RPV8_9HELO|nr:hypothetical protein G7Y89_g4630 [Cudoniella acicularis]